MVKDKVKKSLFYSILDGSFYSVMVGFGESFFAAFAVFLKASNIQLGLLGSLPQAVGSLFQLFTNRLLNIFKSRKKFVLTGALLQALMYIPIALVFFFGKLSVPLLLFFASLYWLFGMIVGPAWNSWMGDLVDEKERGKYFGNRNKITGIPSFFSLLIAGYLLQRFTEGQMQYAGFILIFSIALIARLVSFFYLSKKYEPPYETIKESTTFLDFVLHAKNNHFGIYVLFLCFMNFAVFIAGPFFSAYMLYDLKLDYWSFTIVNASAVIVKMLMMPVWGKAIDRFGTRKVLTLSTFLTSFVPILWIFSGSVSYLISIQLYSGIVWAAFELSSFNFMFDTTKPEKRALYVSYYNVLNGLFILLGAVVGGLLIKYNFVFWSNYYMVFVVSFILRIIIGLYFVPKLSEVRSVEHTSYKDMVLYVITTTPTMGLIYRIVSTNRKIMKKSKFREKIKKNLKSKFLTKKDLIPPKFP